MRAIREITRKYYVKEATIYLLIYLLVFGLPIRVAVATPTNPEVVKGVAGVTQSGNNTTVTMNSKKAVINWDSLNTSSNEVLQFVKASGRFVVLNRVAKGGATQFDGSLFGNQGHIIVVNPHGIVFGGTAFIDAYKFTASALDISNTDFMNGIYKFAGGDGPVANYGKISAEQVALIGKQVLNAGIISSPGGYVLMAAGDRVLLGQEGSNVVVEVASVTLPKSEGQGDVVNEGTVEAAGGKIVLAAGDTFSRAIEGLDTLALSVNGGTGRVVQSGTLNADGATGNGGSVTLTAADEVVLNNGSLTSANGGTNGDGGQVIVYSPGKAIFDNGAQIQAKGGSQSGDGGFAEISGKQQFVLAGDLDLSAQNGAAGRLLLDPTNLTIADGARPATPAPDTVYEKDVEDFSVAGVDVRYEADKGITVQDIADNEITGGSGDITFLTRTALGSYINFDDKDDTIRTTTGDITMIAGTGGIDIGALITDTTDITVTPNPAASPGEIKLLTIGGGDIDTGPLQAQGGSNALISVVSSGNLTVHGDVDNLAAWAATRENNPAAAGNAQVCLQAAGDIEITGSVFAWAAGASVTNAGVHICADGSVAIDVLADGQVIAEAATASPAGAADASIMVHAGPGHSVSYSGDGGFPFLAIAGVGEDPPTLAIAGFSPSDTDVTVDGAHASIDIQNNYAGGCPDCPRPDVITTTTTVTGTDTTTDIETTSSTDIMTSTATHTDTATATNTDTATSTVSNTSTVTSTGTVTNTQTATDTSTATNSDTTTNTGTLTNTNTETNTQTETSTVTNTETVTNTNSETTTHTESSTETATSTQIASNTYTATDTQTSTDTKTSTSSETLTHTFTDTETATIAETATGTELTTSTLTTTDTYTLTSTLTTSATDTTTHIETSTQTATDTHSAIETQTGTSTETATETSITIGVGTGLQTYTLVDTSTITNTDTMTNLAPLTLIIKNGNGPAQTGVVYEQDIEAYSAIDGVNMEYKAWNGITFNDILDGAITGGSGNMTFVTLSINGFIKFDDKTNTIVTTTGNIALISGSGGINIGNLQTGVDHQPKSSMINIVTVNGGNINTGYVHSQGGDNAFIGVISDGDLTINGSVASATNQVPQADFGEALLCLMASGNITINGGVTVDTHGKNATIGDIRICAGKNATVTGKIDSEAKTSESGSTHTALATIEVHAGWNQPGPGTITLNGTHAEAWVSGTGSPQKVNGIGSANQNLTATNGQATAHIEINNDVGGPCPGCATASTQTVTATHTDTMTNTDTSTITQTTTNTSTMTNTITDTGTLTNTQTITNTETATNTNTLTDTATLTNTNTLTNTSTNTQTSTDTDTLTGTDTVSNTATLTNTQTDTQTLTDTDTLTNTGTLTNTDTATDTSTNTQTLTNTDTQTNTETATATQTETNTETITNTETATATQTSTNTETNTDTSTLTNTNTETTTQTLTNTDTRTDTDTVVSAETATNTETITNTETVTSTDTLIDLATEEFIPAAPLPLPVEVKLSGCPVLLDAASNELGVSKDTIQISIQNALAVNPNIQPCDTCAKLVNAVAVLKDADGSKMAALAAVINQIAPADVPFTPEMGTMIATAFAENTMAEGSNYAVAAEYLDAFVNYVAALDTMGSPVGDSTAFVMAKYGTGISENANPNIAAYVAIRLAAKGG